MIVGDCRMHRGEPFSFADRSDVGAVTTGLTMRAAMKPVRFGESKMPRPEVAVVSPGFATTFVAAAGAAAAYWLHSLTAAQTAQIPAGLYLADSSLLSGGAVIWTSDPVRITVADAASAVT